MPRRIDDIADASRSEVLMTFFVSRCDGLEYTSIGLEGWIGWLGQCGKPRGLPSGISAVAVHVVVESLLKSKASSDIPDRLSMTPSPEGFEGGEGITEVKVLSLVVVSVQVILLGAIEDVGRHARISASDFADFLR